MNNFPFKTARAEDGARRKSWLERALPIFFLLGLLNVGVNIAQSWDDWHSSNNSGDARVKTLAMVEKNAVERGVVVLSLMNQAVKDAADFGSLDQEQLRRIQSRYRPLLGQVEIAMIGNDGIPIISSHKDMVDILGGSGHLAKLLAQPWTQTHMAVMSDAQKSTAFFKRATVNSRALNIVVIVQNSSELFLNRNVSKASVAVLYDGEGRTLATFPADPDMAPGQRVEFSSLRPGATPGSLFGTWSVDGSERLVLKRAIDVQEEKPWTIEVGFASDAFLAGWQRSVWANGLGVVIMAALLAFGSLMLRREKMLRERLRHSGDALGAVVSSLPLPVLLVDSDSGNISMSNESTKDVFGALAGEGEPAGRLFTESVQCAAVLSGEHGAEPIPLLTRKGEVEFQVHCTPIGTKGDRKNVSVITLIDVSSHQTQIKSLRSAVNMDALTGLGNRHCFGRVELQMVARVSHDVKPMAVLMIDIDFFKRVNDSHGHPNGDRVLVSVAQQLGSTLRDHDSAFRLGGEEFCVVLWDASAVQASMVAERLRVLVQCTPVTLESGEVISVTCSVGVSQYRAGETNLQAALQRADVALYRAKNNGRNRVELNFEEVAPESGNQLEGNEYRQPLV
jgi:diguanylate cyclase (GGDEF)-like protein